MAEIAVGWVGIVTNVLASLFIVYSAKNVQRRRSQIQWSARHFDQLDYALKWSLLFVIVERNLQILGGLCGYFEMPFELRWFLNNVFAIGFLAAFILRAWLVHYDYHSGLALTNLVSNSEIDEEQRSIYQWFLDNKRNYGAPKYMTRFAISMTVIINLFMLGWSLISPASFVFGMICIYAVLVVIAVGITTKIRILLNDNFFIAQEILIEFRFFALLWIVGGLLIILGPGMGWNWCGFFLIELSVFTVLAMCFIATNWVMHQSIVAGLEDPNGDALKVSLAAGTPPISLALHDRKATMEFLQHLIREISVENMFFLADVMAYKQSFVSQGKLRSLGEGEWPVNTKLARLLYRRTFTHYAWAISKTYIDGSSSLYVTAISEEVRAKLVVKLEELDPTSEQSLTGTQLVALLQDVQAVFNEAAEEVYGALQKSYARFSHTAQFANITIKRQIPLR
eukprot:CAMPEP_0202689220 /NCGR_PEP_ID=MMETSP1385-20130828/4528_1 /ASSEMBLY_ACC=CAM_ASM_000861 /TAXON_ID=933848 /ORGANISM="Elphidium margaritaceum" /LENGTH=452 /DNA_ID=CAMNT_0049344323 /DNA_START=105 /DNA_END=1463 /DNA_ORIENTATION=-